GGALFLAPFSAHARLDAPSPTPAPAQRSALTGQIGPKRAATASRVGMAMDAPTFSVLMPATRLAQRTASRNAGGSGRDSSVASAPLNASPAPTVSTACTGSAATR